jgi:hypothetical protein
LQDESGRKREDEWFLKNERELIEKARKEREKREGERAAAEQEGERKRLLDLHYMKCPKCGHDLREEVLEGVTIDRCSFCEGLWFDANEFESVVLRKTEARQGLFKKLLGV